MDNNAINKNMTTTTQDNQPKKVPDERGGIRVEAHIKIFDPQTKQVFVKGRA
jgi:hypothetical protein